MVHHLRVHIGHGAQLTADGAPHHGIGVHMHQGQAVQVAPLHAGAKGQRVVVPQEQRHAFAEQALGGQLGMRLADVGAQRQIGLAREHLRHHLRGIAVVQRGHQLRMRC